MLIGELREKITKAQLTYKEGEIAVYILDHIYEVCFMSASELAKQLDTSNTSVNRTAKALGYHVFADMQKELQEYVAKQAELSDRRLSLTPVGRMSCEEQESPPQELLHMMHENTVSALGQVLRLNPVEKLDHVVKLLAESETRYINGYRNTADIANKMGYLMELVNSNVIVASGDPVSSMARLAGIGPQDVVFVISFSRYYEATQDALELCHSRGAKIVLLIDRVSAPLAHLADVVLFAEVDSLSFFNSNVTALFLVEVICAKLTRYLGKCAEERLSLLEPFMRKLQSH